MAYGCQASLDHALPRIEKASESLAKRLQIEREFAQSPGRAHPTLNDEILRELFGAVAYLADAVRYLKEGVP